MIKTKRLDFIFDFSYFRPFRVFRGQIFLISDNVYYTDGKFIVDYRKLKRRNFKLLTATANCQNLSADVNVRTKFRIVFGLPQNFAGYRRGIAFAEKNISNQISYRIAFAPTEINVRDFFRFIA